MSEKTSNKKEKTMHSTIPGRQMMVNDFYWKHVPDKYKRKFSIDSIDEVI